MVRDELLYIKTKIADRIIILILIFLFLPLITSITRWVEIGWQNIFVFHLILYASLIATAILRKHLTLTTKVITLSLIYAVSGLVGLWKFGFSGVHYFMILSIAITSALAKRKIAYVMILIVFLIYIAIGVAYISGNLRAVVDLNKFSHTTTQWITILTSLLAFTVVFIAGFRYYYEELIIAIKDKQIITDRLQEQNEELKKAKTLAKNNERIVEQVSKNLPYEMIFQAIVGIEKRKFTYVSDTVKQFYGIEASEALENSSLIYGKIHPEDIEPLKSVERQAIENLSEINTEVRVYNPDNTIRWSAIKANMRKENGKYFLDGIEINITKSKQKEHELIQARKKAEESDQLKTQFIHNMSHEIRTPMNGIMGFASLLNNDNLEDKKNQYVGIIQNSSKQLLRIIDDILEISRLETKQIKAINGEVSLNNLLMDQFSIFGQKAKDNNLTLYLKKGMSDRESKIISDESKLRKIISNLLENAIKYTPEGYVELGYIKEDETLKIYVKDSGIGIEKEKRELIFDRFSKQDSSIRNDGGLGLGLSIAKENAEIIGGKIQLESIPGEGSVFYIVIPYTPAIPERKINLENDHNHVLTHTILIAEDDEVNFLFLEEVLNENLHEKVRIIHAINGKEAVDYCNTDHIDLVLMDIKMPVLDGIEALRVIKQNHPALPVIIQTAYTANEDQEMAMNAGCDFYLSKPIDKEELISIISSLLGTKRHLLI